MSPFVEAAIITGAGGTVVTALVSSESAPSATGILLWAAGVVTAIGVLWRFFHVGELITETRNFLKSYNGEPERKGYPARPGLPERLAKIESMTHEVKGALPAIMSVVEETSREVAEVKAQGIKTDARVTEHRRRGELQADILRQELDQRARSLEFKLDARNALVDEKLSHLSEDLLRSETMRSSLHELGIAIEPDGGQQ